MDLLVSNVCCVCCVCVCVVCVCVVCVCVPISICIHPVYKYTERHLYSMYTCAYINMHICTCTYLSCIYTHEKVHFHFLTLTLARD